jgi:NAD(P)-dependent dehydrogenase (short-subunit alcohol dehydrogenase family)
LQINVTFDQNQNSLPAGFVAAVNFVVNYYDNLFTNNTTINIHVGFGEISGQALGSGALGESYAAQYVLASYSSVRNALLAQGAPGASTLPSSSPLAGSLYLAQAEAQALGLVETSRDWAAARCASHDSSRQGKIINIASVRGELARPGIAPYTATKGAVKNLTRGKCADWAGEICCLDYLEAG